MVTAVTPRAASPSGSQLELSFSPLNRMEQNLNSLTVIGEPALPPEPQPPCISKWFTVKEPLHASFSAKDDFSLSASELQKYLCVFTEPDICVHGTREEWLAGTLKTPTESILPRPPSSLLVRPPLSSQPSAGVVLGAPAVFTLRTLPLTDCWDWTHV